MSARPPIKPLPELLISQIAAGEVVERPASVVKELVENALDAGARQVQVELEQGGLGRILVRDDGWGMAPAELPLALGRHCTSKLRRLDDLDELLTLGFRGEALPSIAAVARLSLTSCVAGAGGAFRVSLEGKDGRPEPVPAAHPPGTSVEVRDLFFNVPARRRFLKSPRTEFEHIDLYLRRLALSRPDVGFTLSHDGRRCLGVLPDATEATSVQRLAALCGRAFADAAVMVDRRVAELRLLGAIAQPERYAPTHSGLQNWVVNGRVVRDPALTHAVRAACGERLPPGRYPAHAFCLWLDPHGLDVNVHPTKLEVRYRDPRRVHDFVLSAVREALAASTEHPEPGVVTGRSYRPRTASSPVALETRVSTPVAASGGQPAPGGLLSPGRQAWLVEQQGSLRVIDLAHFYAAAVWLELSPDTALQVADGAPSRSGLPLLDPVVRPSTSPDGSRERQGGLELLGHLGLRLEWGREQVRLLAAPACLRAIDPPRLLDRLLALGPGDWAADESEWALRLATWVIREWPPTGLAGLLRRSPPDCGAAPPGATPFDPLWHDLPLGAGPEQE